ncbi:MAG: NAD(P)H-binding protein [Candidatus Krumholzibacteriia bacterium]
MSIVITTPTGHIGSVVTSELLARGEKPVLVARDATRVSQWTRQGATVVEGSHADPDVMTAATRGAEALFVLTPSSYQIDDIQAYYGSFARAAAAAAKANDIPHVVHLSSVGAELAAGNGPVAGLHAAEAILNAAGIANLTHLRPPYFMENTLMQIGNILNTGSLSTSFPAGTRFPMIATRDIGVRAAELLHRRDWRGARVMELQGPGEISYDDVAQILSDLLGRPISHVTVTREQLVAAIAGMGVSRVMAESLGELSEAIATGLVRAHERRTEANTTPTSYREFAGLVFKPAFAAAAKG